MKTLSVSSETELAEPLLALTRELLASGYKVRISLSGYSMFPFLKQGGHGIIGACGTAGIKKGDVIAYEQNKKIILHRVWLTRQNQHGTFIVCRGDAQKDFDRAIIGNEVIGLLEHYSFYGYEISLNNFHARFFKFLALHFPFILILAKRMFFTVKYKLLKR